MCSHFIFSSDKDDKRKSIKGRVSFGEKNEEVVFEKGSSQSTDGGSVSNASSPWIQSHIPKGKYQKTGSHAAVLSPQMKEDNGEMSDSEDEKCDQLTKLYNQAEAESQRKLAKKWFKTSKQERKSFSVGKLNNDQPKTKAGRKQKTEEQKKCDSGRYESDEEPDLEQDYQLTMLPGNILPDDTADDELEAGGETREKEEDVDFSEKPNGNVELQELYGSCLSAEIDDNLTISDTVGMEQAKQAVKAVRKRRSVDNTVSGVDNKKTKLNKGDSASVNGRVTRARTSLDSVINAEVENNRNPTRPRSRRTKSEANVVDNKIHRRSVNNNKLLDLNKTSSDSLCVSKPKTSNKVSTQVNLNDPDPFGFDASSSDNEDNDFDNDTKTQSDTSQKQSDENASQLILKDVGSLIESDTMICGVEAEHELLSPQQSTAGVAKPNVRRIPARTTTTRRSLRTNVKNTTENADTEHQVSLESAPSKQGQSKNKVFSQRKISNMIYGTKDQTENILKGQKKSIKKSTKKGSGASHSEVKKRIENVQNDIRKYFDATEKQMLVVAAGKENTVTLQHATCETNSITRRTRQDSTRSAFSTSSQSVGHADKLVIPQGDTLQFLCPFGDIEGLSNDSDSSCSSPIRPVESGSAVDHLLKNLRRVTAEMSIPTSAELGVGALSSPDTMYSIGEVKSC